MTLKTTAQRHNMSKSATVLSVFAIFDKSKNLFYLKCAKTIANSSKNARRRLRSQATTRRLLSPDYTHFVRVIDANSSIGITCQLP